MKGENLNRKSSDKYDFAGKIVIIGDSGVGKTNILLCFCEEEFKPNYIATIGVDFKVKTVIVDGLKIKLQIWDTAGQQRFKNITQTYYKGAAGIILTYSVTDRNSFQGISNWMKQISENAPVEIRRILVANKIDSPDRVVSRQQGQELAKDHNIPFVEVSAKDGINIKEIFQMLGHQILKVLSRQKQPVVKQSLSVKASKATHSDSSCKC